MPTPEEVEGNSPAEELERERQGEEQPGPSYQSGTSKTPSSFSAGLPGGLATKPKGKGGGPFTNQAGLGGIASGASSNTGGLQGRLRFMRSRKAIVIGGIATATVIGSIVGIVEFIQFEIVHIEEVVTHEFDKRLQHTIDKRIANHYAKVFAESGARGGNNNTGDPIADADHNISLGTLADDAGFTGTVKNSSGEVVAVIDKGGNRLPINSSTLEDPGSPLMEHLNNRFPPLDFFRESIRSNIQDSNWGIVRNFLSGKEEPVSEDRPTLDKQVSDAVTSVDEGTTGATDPHATEEDKAKADLKASADSAKSEGTYGVGAANAALNLCGAVQISESIHKDLWIVRVAQLMRISNGVILNSGHQAKTGNLHASQLQSLMKLLAGFSKSGAWQVISHSKGAKVSAREQSRFSASPTGTLSTLTSKIDTASPVCDPVNAAVNSAPFGLGPVLAGLSLDGVESILGPEETVLTDLATQLALSGVKMLAIGDVLNYLVGFATDAATKPIIDVASPTIGADLASATVSGYDNYSNMYERANGGEKLTTSQVVALDSAANADEVRVANTKGLAYQLFSPSYHFSLTSIFMDKAPMAPVQVASGMGTMFSAITSPFNPVVIKKAESYLFSISPVASASDATADPADMGVDQNGLPDELLAKYNDTEANEAIIKHYLCSQPPEKVDQPGLYDGQCTGGGDSKSELTDQNDDHNDPYHDFVAECLTNPDSNAVAADSTCSPDTHGVPGAPDIYDRFRVYRFDLGMANMMTSYNNNEDDQSIGGSSTSTPVISGGSCTNPFPGGWAPGRLDMGYDGTFTGKIVAPCPGTITYAATSFSNWGGYIEIKFDQKISALPSSTLYFAEGVAPISANEQGKHFNAGEPIAKAYTTGAQAGIPGNIEWGVAQDLPNGSTTGVTDTYTKTLGNGTPAAVKMVLDFSKWAQAIGVAAPSDTSNAGSP